ncbi:outer membrane protein transport protein [Hyphomicrobium sp.]|uniref:OmpP1/FadL family transporter n=1 Tax=Hyphomicrobium sp. TaxID=82 RepID=UPI000F98E605|nr:outer membrane protein transport protein [Hyphomicrobium sp.]RUO97481.1 MAG: aromatic hydrocarbon degradation protein [Hyphomicrobium sp.]
MRNSKRKANAFRLVLVGVGASCSFATTALAGGFDIHEQSTVFLGSASAGVAAGGSIGSMFWNPAATGQFSGFNTESSYTLILPNADVSVTSFAGQSTAGAPSSFTNAGDITIPAVTGASYGTYQVSKDLFLGMAINSPFGLATKPDNVDYLGSYLGVTSKLITINANPTIAYRIAPGVTIGAGIQIEWAQTKLQFRTSSTSIAQFLGEGWAVGATAGIMLEPVAGTTIGLGYRSQMTHDLDGNLSGLGPSHDATSTLDLPDIVTLSLRQEMTPTTRLLGTVEWTNWSRFQNVAVSAPGIPALNVAANWNDGWFFSLGGEYDYSPLLTLRSGVAYELSPIDDASKRLVQVPDNNRVWLNIGASYKCEFCRSLLNSEQTTLDFGYSHVFIQDGAFDLETPTGIPVTGLVRNAEFDLLSMGVRTKW